MQKHSFIHQNVHEKKVLALVLAFACAFTMFAGAAFTDAADISQTEAVDMLTALGVIDGYEDGSFQPDKTVTRAEMAKMIYTIRNGGSDVVTQYEGYTTPFTDVENVNHWAKGYIAYCYANGIIDGKSATTFDPDATVTGTEAAKMALVLIGYDANRAGLVGSAWSTNTINLATQKDLFQNYTISITGGCDRQFAAQLLYNTLWACTVRWSADAEGYEDVTTNNGSSDGVTTGLLNVTVAKKYMGLEEIKCIYWGDSKINTGLTAGQTSVSAGTGTITYVPENGNEWLGESVKVLYKESKDGNMGLDKYDTIYGMTLSGETSTVKATLGDIGDDDNGKIDVNGTKYELASPTIWVNDGAVEMDGTNNAATFTDTYSIEKDTTNKIFATDSGFKQSSADEIKLVLNNNGKVVRVYVSHVNFYKVTGLTSGKISLAGLGTLDIDDNTVVADDVAVNDIVAMTTLYDGNPSDDDAFNTIEKATVVSDVKVTDMKSATEVMIDGAYAKYAKINDCVTTADSNYVSEVELDATYDFIMYGDYWVAAKKVSASSKDIALVTKTAEGINDQVKVMLSDGSEKTYNINDDDGKAATFEDLDAGTYKLYSFTLVGDNDIQLKNGKNTDAVTGLTFTKGVTAKGTNFYDEDTKSIVDGDDTYVAADSAVAFVKVVNEQKKVDTYTYTIDAMKTVAWTNIGSINAKNEFTQGVTNVEYVLNSDNQVVALYIETNKKPGATASTDEYGYIVDDPAQTSVDGSKAVSLSVWNGTETVKLTIEVSENKWAKGMFIKYNIGADGKTDDGDVKILTATGAVKSYEADRKLLTLYTNVGENVDSSKTTTYAVSDDVVIIGVNTKDKELVEGISAVPQAFVGIGDDKDITTDDSVTANILYVIDDNKVVAIFVDTNNSITAVTSK